MKYNIINLTLEGCLGLSGLIDKSHEALSKCRKKHLWAYLIYIIRSNIIPNIKEESNSLITFVQSYKVDEDPFISKLTLATAINTLIEDNKDTLQLPILSQFADLLLIYIKTKDDELEGHLQRNSEEIKSIFDNLEKGLVGKRGIDFD